ncbi:MAG: S41 family peptidase, partial [Candidatus Sulfotelmatobacter sp.]
VFTGNLIVLVDSKSASAAELFARVVQLEHRGTVVGDRSSGSVMEALYYPFDDYSGVLVFYGASITSADLIMADGKSLEKVGVTPDVLLLPSAAQLSAGEDPALARAAELAGVKLDPAAAAKLFPFEWAPE